MVVCVLIMVMSMVISGSGELVLTDLDRQNFPALNMTMQKLLTSHRDVILYSDVTTHTNLYVPGTPLSSVVLLINCSRPLDLMLTSSVGRCTCYTRLPLYVIYECPDVTSYKVKDVAMAITQQSSWKEAIVFTDDISPWNSSVHQMALLTHDCSPDSHVTRLLEAYSRQTDYVNMILDCAHTSTSNGYLMKQVNLVKNLTKLKDEHFNWLLIEAADTDWSRLDHLNVVANDNLVRLHPESNLHPLDVYTFSEWPKDGATSGVHVTRCMMKCHVTRNSQSLGTYTSPASVLAHTAPILPADFTQFYGQNLTVVAGSYRPFYIRSGHLGIEPELIQILAQAFNFSYHFVRPSDGKWGSLLDNGTWNGMVGMVIRGEADLCIGGITISESRRGAIDFTTPHFEERNAVLLNLPWSRWGYFYQVFDPVLWLCLSVLPLVCGTVLWIWQYVDWRIFGHAPGSLKQVLFSCYGIALYQGIEVSLYSMSGRLVLFSLHLTVIVVLATYAGNLTATLAIKTVRMPFTSLRELADHPQYSLAITPGSVRQNLFKNAAPGTTYNKIWRKIQADPERSYVTGSRDAVDRMLLDRYVTYSADYTAIRSRMIRSGECSLVMLPETYFTSGFGIGMRKGSPYKRHFDAIIRDTMELGLTKYWYNKHKLLDVCEDITRTSTSGTSITIEDAFWVFVLLGSGSALAMLALVLENLTRKIYKRYTNINKM